MSDFQLPDFAERMFWTIVVIITGWISANVGWLFDMFENEEELKAAVAAFIMWIITYVLRVVVKFIPSPGAGLPGLPTPSADG
jgi:hypothetical protein